MATKRIGSEIYSMKKNKLLTLIGTTLVALSPAAWAAPHGGGGGFAGGGHFGGSHFGGYSGGPHAAPAFSGGGARFSGGFRAAPYRYGALILLVEVSADQPVHSDTTTEAPARLLLGHTNSADGKTNR